MFHFHTDKFRQTLKEIVAYATADCNQKMSNHIYEGSTVFIVVVMVPNIKQYLFYVSSKIFTPG